MTCHECVQSNMGCGNCGQGRGGHGHSFFLRMILGLAIIGIVFSVGVKVGEFKGMFDDEYHSGRTMMRDYPVQQRMMYNPNVDVVPPSSL